MEMAQALTGVSGLLAGTAFLLAAPAWYINSRIMDRTLEVQRFLFRMRSGEELGRDDANRSLIASFSVLFFQFLALLLFIGGVVAARRITMGTPWQRAADFSDSHLSILIICFSIFYFYRRQSITFQERKFKKEDLTAVKKKMKPGQWGILVTSLLLIAVSPLYIPIFLAFYLSGMLAAGFVFEDRRSGKKEVQEERED